MERLRVKSPVPLFKAVPCKRIPVPFKKTTSCGSLLDQIIAKKVTDHSASNGFGLALPYRHNNKKHPARLGGSLPNSPRYYPLSSPTPPPSSAPPSSSPPSRVSPPPSGFAAPSAPGCAAMSSDAAIEAEEDGWGCRICGVQLDRGSDSFLSCRRCGVVDSSPQLVSQTRSKNCPAHEDKTQVADAPHADAHTTELEAYANGPETSDERRRRHLNAAGGSYVPKKTLKLKDMGGAQSSLDKAKAREVRERMDVNGRDATKKRAILRMVEAVFDQIPALDKRVCKHIRLEALHVYGASMQHDSVCGQQGCMISVSARSNAVVGTCVVEHALHQLCRGTLYDNGEAQPNQLLAKTAPEVSPQQLMGSLARVKSLQLRHSSANQRLQVSSAIGIIASWKEGESQSKCAPVIEAPVPPELRLPPSMAGSRDFGSGKCKSQTPEDRAVEKLRHRVLATAKLWRSPPQVRNHALEALTYQSIVTFLSQMGTPDEGLPIDAMSIALLLAAARCLGCNEELPLFAQTIFEQYQLATSTVNAHVTSIAEVMRATIEAKPDDDVF